MVTVAMVTVALVTVAMLELVSKRVGMASFSIASLFIFFKEDMKSIKRGGNCIWN